MKKLLSLFIAMSMMITAFAVPANVFAEETGEQGNRVLLEEDFESEDGSNAFNANCTNVEYNENDDVSEHYGEIAFNAEGQVLATLDIEDVYSGTVRIGFDAYLLGNGNRPVVAIPASDSSSTGEYYLSQVFQREVHVKQRVAGEHIYKATEDGWVRIEQMVNLDTGVIQTELYDMTGNKLASGENNGGDSISKVVFKNWGKSSAFKVDNIIIEICNPVQKERNIFTENFEGSTNLFKSNCTNVKYDENSEHYGEIPNVADTIGAIDFEDVSDGAVELSYDLYLQGNNRLIRAVDTAGKKIYVLQATSRTIKTTNNGEEIAKISADAWVHIEQKLYLDKGTVWTKVYSGNTLIGEKIYNAGLTSIANLEFINKSPATTLRLDNISVDIVNPVIEEKTVFTEQFEGTTNALGEACTNVTYEGVEGSVGEIALGGTGTIDCDSFYGGTVKVSYDAYLKQNNRLIRATGVNGEKYYLAQLMNKEVRFTDGTNIISTPYDGSSDGWIHVEHLLNFDNGVITTKVYSENALVGEGTYEAGCESITKIEILNKSTGAVFHMDNISIETVIDRPEVKEIIVYDVFGNVVENLTGAVNAIEKVEIVFDEDISSFNSAEYFVIKNASEVIKTAGKIKDNVYTMTLKEKLAYGTTYTIEVSKNVIDNDGNAIELDYIKELTTMELADAQSKVQINSYNKADDGTITVDAGFINAETDTLDMVFIVAFYDVDGKMLEISDVKTKNSSDAYGKLHMTFDGYSGTDTVDKVKIFYWDNLGNIKPYGVQIEL